MSESQDLIHDRVQKILYKIQPEKEITHYEINQDGLANDVVILNHNLVFRFPKNEANKKIQATEIKILDLIRPWVKLEIPTPLFRSQDCLENLLPRTRIYAQSIELEWFLLELETGETFWFTAHLGGARDIHSYPI